MGLVLLSFGIGWFGVQGSLVALLAAGILLDLGVQSNMVVSQRAIYSLGAHARARLNAVYMATFFAGGAAGSAIASVAFQRGGWPLVSAIGAAFAAAALAYFATERREVRTAAAV
jgi:predicted MFS family arabinose efflux permease